MIGARKLVVLPWVDPCCSLLYGGLVIFSGLLSPAVCNKIIGEVCKLLTI